MLSTRSSATRSTTSSHDQRRSSRGRHQERNYHPVHSEAEPRGRHVNTNLPDVARSRSHRDSRPDSTRLSATPSVSRPGGLPRPTFNYSEPRSRRYSNISQPDSGRGARSDSGRSALLDYVHSPRPDHSPSPSLLSLRQVSTRQPLQPSSERQVPRVHTVDLVNSTRFISGRSSSPPNTYPGNPVLDDPFDLDESLVRCRSSNCQRAIEHPERGSQGSQGRWYFVCCGRKVGIFNEW